MGLFGFGKKKEDPGLDNITNLRIPDLKTGYLFDYEMETWEVTSRATVYFDEGGTALEWKITSGGKTLYLSYEDDEEVYITVTKKFPIGAIEGDVRAHIMEHEDPPEQIVYNGKTFYLEESGPAEYLADDGDEKEPFIFWEFVDEEEEELLTIEQWSETSFEAAVGKYIEEWQISNILPGGNS